MNAFLKKLYKTILLIGALLFSYILFINRLWGVRTFKFLVGSFLVTLLIIMMWIPRKVLSSASRETITRIEVFRISTNKAEKTYTSSTDIGVIDSFRQICEKRFESFPHTNDKVKDLAIKIVIEDDGEKYDFWLYQSIENPNWILTAWETDKPYFQNAFQITNEEKIFIESLLD